MIELESIFRWFILLLSVGSVIALIPIYKVHFRMVFPVFLWQLNLIIFYIIRIFTEFKYLSVLDYNLWVNISRMYILFVVIGIGILFKRGKLWK